MILVPGESEAAAGGESKNVAELDDRSPAEAAAVQEATVAMRSVLVIVPLPSIAK
jgi:hypothetical protein